MADVIDHITPSPVDELETDDEADQASSRRMDPEIAIINSIVRIIQKCEVSQRSRVVTYLLSRYARES